MDRFWEIAPRRTAQFDATAVAYDTYRPGYPDAMYDRLHLVAALGRASQIVEVGAGTGIATMPFAARGYHVTAVEPGVRLAAIAAEKLAGFASVRVVNCRFEDWVGQPSSYDLVFAADAWHWITPTVGLEKAGTVLKPGGALAIATHGVVGFSPAGFGGRIAEVTALAGQSGRATTVGWGPDPDQFASAIADCGLFGPLDRTTHRFDRLLDADTFVAVQNTYGTHMGLPAEQTARLNRTVRDLIQKEFGGRVTKHEEARLFIARRLSDHKITPAPAFERATNSKSDERRSPKRG